MKAIVCTKYGPPEVLELRELEKPEPKENEVRIRVCATSVTASDCIIRGFKLPRWHPIGIMMGLVVGFTAPRRPILGMVLAGQVEAAGRDVTRFVNGELVYGSTMGTGSQIRFGAYAEYVCLPEESLITKKPAHVSFAEAAAIPYGSMMAINYLQKFNIEPGQKGLIYGASGAIGTAAVQMAKAMGAEVTGVCSTTNLDLVRSLGAAQMIDYTREDALPQGEAYDFVLDAVGKSKSSKLKEASQKALTPRGKYLSVDDGTPRNSQEDISLIDEFLQAGKIKAVIDRTYPLEQIVEAHRYVDLGRKKGNVVISVAQDGGT